MPPSSWRSSVRFATRLPGRVRSALVIALVSVVLALADQDHDGAPTGIVWSCSRRSSSCLDHRLGPAVGERRDQLGHRRTTPREQVARQDR
jgi:hypothetical protein